MRAGEDGTIFFIIVFREYEDEFSAYPKHDTIKLTSSWVRPR
jgi:hypothetical protein